MKKINLNSVKDFLSRDEMRKISGGSGGSCGSSCFFSSDCTSKCQYCYHWAGGEGTNGLCL